MMFDIFQKEFLLVLLGILVVLITCKLLINVADYFYNHPFFKPSNMKPNKTYHFLMYMSCIWSTYKLSRPTLPALSLIMQGLCGACCEVFHKERIFRMNLLFIPGYFFYKPETVQAVLSSSTLTGKSVLYSVVQSWLGTGLLTSKGEKWQKHRKLLTPTFHFQILEDFIPIFQEQSKVFVRKLKELTREPWVDIVPLTTLCTLDIIYQTAMGLRINAQSNENEEYVQAVHDMTGAIIDRGFQPWLYLDILYYMTADGKKYRSNLQRVQGITRKVINEKKADMLKHYASKQDDSENAEGIQCKTKKRKAFLEFLLEYHLKDPSFTEEDIREEVDTFMFAGHDTTGMGLSWILYCVGLYPDVQKKIVEELDEIFQNENEREITREDLTKMKYMECVIKETFRLYPPAPFFIRECNETLEILGYTIYPGSFCFIFPYALHRDPESFPDPERFDPERFFPENSRDRHPYAYIPFSAGPRNCIGQRFAMMEMKFVIASVLRCLRVTSLDPRDKIIAAPNLVLRNTVPLRLHLENR